MILYRFKGLDFAMCSALCAKLFRKWPSQGLGPWSHPKPGITVGCFWCGGDLTMEVERLQ